MSNQSSNQLQYAQVIIPLPIDMIFYYKVPNHFHLSIGDHVIVPFGNAQQLREENGHLQIGCIFKLLDQDPKPEIKKKAILQHLSHLPPFNEKLLTFLDQLAKYYHITIGEALKLAQPISKKQQSLLLTAKGIQLYQSIKKDSTSIDQQHRFLMLAKLLSSFTISSHQIPYQVTQEELHEWIDTGLIEQTLWPHLGDQWDWYFKLTQSQTDQNQQMKKRKSKQSEIEDLILETQVKAYQPLKEKYQTASIKKALTSLYLNDQIEFELRHQEDEWLRADDLRGEANGSINQPIQSNLAQSNLAPQFMMNQEQQVAIKSIIQSKNYEGFLLYGITGSGKTEVYLEAIDHYLKQGKNALVLVPEIGLTPQTIRRFKKRFGDCIEVWHSQISPQMRFKTWLNFKSNKPLVLIGTRSALFCPIERLGIIIVDEAHDPSYKQNEGIRYHARDMALLRAKLENCPVVLGSATPSLENIYLAQQKKLTLLKLTQRPANAILPKVHLIDLKSAQAPVADAPFLTYPLINAIQTRLNRNEQSILFLNRRGFSESMRCLCCGYLFKCMHCNIAYTWHQRKAKLKCHYCSAVMDLPHQCPDCKQAKCFVPVGRGTEKVEDQLAQIFPKARIARLDRDSEEDFESFEKKMRLREIDIVIGTQMVSKGHDFPYVTLVGVLDADKGLDLPDFRAAEKSYQLLSQVAGRAGRGHLQGEVYLQTFRPEHPFLKAVIEHNFDDFCMQELLVRQLILYPPYSYCLLIRVEREVLSDVDQVNQIVIQALEKIDRQQHPINVRGPMPAPLSLLAGRNRSMTMILAKKRESLHVVIDTIQAQIKGGVIFDIDPTDFF